MLGGKHYLLVLQVMQLLKLLNKLHHKQLQMLLMLLITQPLVQLKIQEQPILAQMEHQEQQEAVRQAEEGLQEVLHLAIRQDRRQQVETPRMGVVDRIRAIILQVQITLLGMEQAAMIIRQEDRKEIRKVTQKKALLEDRLKKLKKKKRRKK